MRYLGSQERTPTRRQVRGARFNRPQGVYIKTMHGDRLPMAELEETAPEDNPDGLTRIAEWRAFENGVQL